MLKKNLRLCDVHVLFPIYVASRYQRFLDTTLTCISRLQPQPRSCLFIISPTNARNMEYHTAGLRRREQARIEHENSKHQKTIQERNKKGTRNYKKSIMIVRVMCFSPR